MAIERQYEAIRADRHRRLVLAIFVGMLFEARMAGLNVERPGWRV